MPGQGKHWPERVYLLEDRGLKSILGDLLNSREQETVFSVWEKTPVGAAFDRGITEETWRGLTAVKQSAPHIQQILRRLSPLERNGLGTFDYLHELFLIDDLYFLSANGCDGSAGYNGVDSERDGAVAG